MGLIVELKKRVVLYGPPKTGKTTSLATIPRGDKLYLVDLDRQLGSFAKEWNRRKHPTKNLKLATVDSAGDRSTWDIVQDIKQAMWSPPKGFQWYAVDCMTTMGLLLTHEFIGKGEDREYSIQNNTELVSCVTDYFWQFVATAESEGAWVVLIFHESWQEIKTGLVDPKTQKMRDKKEQLAPQIASGAKVTIPGQCPFVWHVEKGREVVRGKAVSSSNVRTQGTPLIMASSDEYDDVLNNLEPLDFDKLITKMNLKGGRKKRR